MPTVDNPYDKLRVLLNQVKDAIESIPGLEMFNHGFNAAEGADILQFAVRLDPAIVFAPEVVIPDEAVTTNQEAFDAEQAAFNAQFDTLVADVKGDEFDQTMHNAADQLRKNLESLRDDEGLGFDG